MQQKTSIEGAKNIGPICGGELRSVGIDTLEELISVGWEEAFIKIIENYPERLHLNMATALIGAVENCDWRKVPTSLKQEAKSLIRHYKRGYL